MEMDKIKIYQTCDVPWMLQIEDQEAIPVLDMLSAIKEAIDSIPEDCVKDAAYQIGISGDADYGFSVTHTISWERLETDEEFEERRAREEKAERARKDAADRREKLKEFAEFEEYKRLKEKFEK